MKFIILLLGLAILSGCESYHVEQNSRNGPSCEGAKKDGVLFSYEECTINVIEQNALKSAEKTAEK